MCRIPASPIVVTDSSVQGTDSEKGSVTAVPSSQDGSVKETSDLPKVVAQLAPSDETTPTGSRSFFARLKRAFRLQSRVHQTINSSDSESGGATNIAQVKEEPVATEGTRLEVKRLDHIFDRKTSLWVKRDSKQTQEQKKKKAEHAEFAFIVLRTFNVTSDPTLHNITTTYEIQSPQLRKVGRKVIGHELGISWTATTVTVR